MVSLHINAKKKEISEKVIVCGDPIRIKFIAKNYLTNAKKINTVRNMFGYTGFFKKERVSILSHGMGMPSVSIYVQELISHYHVKKIIRLGTCGTVLKNINIKDILIGMSACTDSYMNRIRFNNFDFSAVADFSLLKQSYRIAKKFNFSIRIGAFFTTDLFYANDNKVIDIMKRHNILGIDMETAGIYFLASEHNIQALSMCIVSDHLKTGEKLNTLERISSFEKIIQIALRL
ncbi:Purine nucleoside phosphorylase DeoD-type [Buchnera aphidicola (Thelaxes suberi)]|uniref:purine-nucleoside phosphorylase n=1 Tax=Buchnera aphidicola TaxID=9 RepID=UPI003464CA69